MSNKLSIPITDGNINNTHIYIAPHYNFLPGDCFGSPKKTLGKGNQISIFLAGMNKTIQTDIAVDGKTGKPRREFRGRKWVREFFQYHGVRAGDILELERKGARRYKLSVQSEYNKKCYSASEFFAGIGLVRLALEKHGFQVSFANDIDPDKFEIYKQNFSSDEFKLDDIHQLKPSDIPDCVLATASFPCNDLSVAGARRGINNGQSSAFWGFTDIIKKMRSRRPPIVLLENVPGFLKSHNGQDFESALLSLNRLGYVCDAFFVDALSFVPQSRLRLFVIGVRDVPSKECPFIESVCRPRDLINFFIEHQNIRWHVRDLPHPPKRATRLDNIVEKLPKDHPAWWNESRAAYFMNQLSERHLNVAKNMMEKSRYTYGTAFRRVRKGRSMAELRVDGIAGCLRTPRGGSGRQILFKAGCNKYQVRLLTPRECARLQGVPDKFNINVTQNKALFGFGDAVCVPVIEWIAENYLLNVIKELKL